MRTSLPILSLISLTLGVLFAPVEDVWGFFGHRLINRVAVFTLPMDVLPFYKENIEYVTAHSIDPDRRRYASNVEAVRHYIDLDIWADDGYEHLPRILSDAMIKYGHLHLIDTESQDTLKSWHTRHLERLDGFTEEYRHLLSQELSNHTTRVMDDGYYTLSGEWYPADLSPSDGDLIFTEDFSQHGIVPYHLMSYTSALTKAFEDQNVPRVLRLSAEIGHYIADAHVPLHTTENYNGQLSNQTGIHAFWESRVPELFAESQYDFFVGEAEYIEDLQSFFWDIVMTSHALVYEVLAKELEVKATLSQSQQYCFEERGGQSVRTECSAFALAYQESMKGMVEDRMRDAIVSVGSVWYTAWVDAGRPALGGLVAPEFLSEEILPALQDSLSKVHHR